MAATDDALRFRFLHDPLLHRAAHALAKGEAPTLEQVAHAAHILDACGVEEIRRDDRGRPLCHFCGAEMTRLNSPGSWHQTVGWVQKRSGGGAHAVSLSEPTGRVACPSCMSLKRAGAEPQTSEPQTLL